MRRRDWLGLGTQGQAEHLKECGPYPISNGSPLEAFPVGVEGWMTYLQFEKAPTGCQVEDAFDKEGCGLVSVIWRLLSEISLRLGWEGVPQGDGLSVGERAGATEAVIDEIMGSKGEFLRLQFLGILYNFCHYSGHTVNVNSVDSGTLEWPERVVLFLQ